jgi:RNA polymerase primary sigma factor
MTRITAQPQGADIYLAEIGRYPLLDNQQEIELAIQVQQGKRAERQLAEKVPRDRQERHDLEQAVQRGERARRRLIECNLRLAVSLTKRFQYLGLPFGDLIQEANMGLMKAVERFDHRRGVRFATYACWWIQQTVQRAASRARTIRFPFWMYGELGRLRRERHALEAGLGRPPTLQELAERMETPVPKIRQMLTWDQEILSLQMPVGDQGNSELADLIPDEKSLPVEQAVGRRLLAKDLRDAMVAHLDPRDREVLSMRFGLDGKGERTLDQVAQVFGITRERARQLQKRALKRLRERGKL